MTNIKCLNDAFKIAQYYLNKEKSFECLNNNDPVLCKNGDKNDTGYITINNVASDKTVNNEVLQPLFDHCINEINLHQPVDQRYPPRGYQGFCYSCGQWGHMARSCSKHTNISNDSVHHEKEIPHAVSPTPKMVSSQSSLPPRTAFKKGKDYSVMRVGKSLLTQIKEDNFILGDTLSDELSNLVKEVAEQNVLLTKASRPTTLAGYRNYATSRNKQAAPASAQMHTFLLKNNKMGDVKKLTPVTPQKSVRFSLTTDIKGLKPETKDKPTEDLINLVQSDEIPTYVDRDSSETEPELPFKNDNGKTTNFIIE